MLELFSNSGRICGKRNEVNISGWRLCIRKIVFVLTCAVPNLSCWTSSIFNQSGTPGCSLHYSILACWNQSHAFSWVTQPEFRQPEHRQTIDQLQDSSPLSMQVLSSIAAPQSQVYISRYSTIWVKLIQFQFHPRPTQSRYISAILTSEQIEDIHFASWWEFHISHGSILSYLPY